MNKLQLGSMIDLISSYSDAIQYSYRIVGRTVVVKITTTTSVVTKVIKSDGRIM